MSLVKVSSVLGHVMVQVFCLDITTERVGVSNQEFATVGVFRLEVIIIKLIHYQFRNCEYTKSNRDGFIHGDTLACSANKHEIVNKQRKVDRLTAFASLFGSHIRRTLTQCLTCSIVLPKVAFAYNFAKSDLNLSRAIFQRSVQ